MLSNAGLHRRFWAEAASIACYLINRSASIAICNEHGTIYAISSDFGDQMATQSMGLMVLLSEHF